MGALLFLFGAALAAGLYFVLADLLKIPRLATERALISAGRRERSLVKSLEALILGWALKLAPLIRMDEYKYRRLENKLTAAGLDMTPQVYTAYSLLKPCLILLGIIPCLLILPILSPLIVVLAVLMPELMHPADGQTKKVPLGLLAAVLAGIAVSLAILEPLHEEAHRLTESSAVHEQMHSAAPDAAQEHAH